MTDKKSDIWSNNMYLALDIWYAGYPSMHVTKFSYPAGYKYKAEDRPARSRVDGGRGRPRGDADPAGVDAPAGSDGPVEAP